MIKLAYVESWDLGTIPPAVFNAELEIRITATMATWPVRVEEIPEEAFRAEIRRRGGLVGDMAVPERPAASSCWRYAARWGKGAMNSTATQAVPPKPLRILVIGNPSPSKREWLDYLVSIGIHVEIRLVPDLPNGIDCDFIDVDGEWHGGTA